MEFTTIIISCRERGEVLEQTLARLADTGWQYPHVLLDDERAEGRLQRIAVVWRRALQRAASAPSRFALLLEDDLLFGRFFHHNLTSWPLLHAVPERGGAFYGSLYNPNRPYRRRVPTERYMVAEPRLVWGSQALVLTPAMARYLDEHWDEAAGNPDQRMPLLASRVTPIYYHDPPLVDHAPVPTTWGGIDHRAHDFDVEYRAETS